MFVKIIIQAYTLMNFDIVR